MKLMDMMVVVVALLVGLLTNYLIKIFWMQNPKSLFDFILVVVPGATVFGLVGLIRFLLQGDR